MQNGQAALSLISYDYAKQPRRIDFKKLLNTLYQHNGKGTQVAVSYFYPIYNQVPEQKRNRTGFAEFFLKQITKKPNKNLVCTYCGVKGANEMVSYVFPYIIQLDKYPNTYSFGRVRSLNFCQKCMLTSFAANNRLLFRANRPSRRTYYVSTLMFFSKDADDLRKFYQGFIDEVLTPSNFTNMNIFGKSYARRYDRTWYPEEFLAVLLDYIAVKIKEFGSIEKNLGVVMSSFTRLSTGAGATLIYDSFDIIDDLNPFIRSISRVNSKNPDAFRILFSSLRTSESTDNAGDFTERRKFFRQLLVHRRFDWKAIQMIVVYNAGLDRAAPYLNSFISVTMDQLSLSGKVIFEKAREEGRVVGTRVKRNEINPKVRKKFLYDFRRARRQQDFLDLLNLVQLQVEMDVNTNPFVESEEFEMAKCGFLIGFANAIFQRS